MARKPDLPCADCGKLMWSGTGSLPAGMARCQPCRRLRPTAPATRPCQQCGAMFSGPGIQRACSIACGQLLRYADQSKPKRTRPCEVCGQQYSSTYSKQRTCGRTCGGVLTRTNYPVCHVRPGECQICGALFVSRGKREPHKHCSKQCSDTFYNRARRAPVVEQRRTCRHCGQWFACSSNSMKRYCTAQCAKQRMRENHGRHYRERARKAGVAYERIHRRKVYERDKWRCGICRRKVNPKLTYPHPNSASLDHVIPMSLGGPHLHHNVQCSHLQCNVDKSNGGSGEQLALVG